jgi:hypothetical protein
MSSVGVGLRRNSHTSDGGGGDTFTADGRGVSGYDGGAEAFFLL